MKAGVIQPATGSAPQRRPSAAKTWLKAIELTSRIEAEPRRLFADFVEEWAQQQPGHLALLSGGQFFTYGELAARINRYARWALGQSIRSGRTVCLLMPNRPDYLACWLGISRVGGTVALINTRLVGRSLAHCIDIARADHIVIAADCVDVFETARPHLDRVPQTWSLVPEASAPIWMRRSPLRTRVRCPPPNAATSRSMDARSSSTPRAQRGCRRPRTSVIAAFSVGADGLPGWRTLPSTIAFTIACRSIIPWAVSSRPAACSAPEVRS
jgi:acyl-CoA synthetase (AMP-forming)/AMP-acid ligase II